MVDKGIPANSSETMRGSLVKTRSKMFSTRVGKKLFICYFNINIWITLIYKNYISLFSMFNADDVHYPISNDGIMMGWDDGIIIPYQIGCIGRRQQSSSQSTAMQLFGILTRWRFIWSMLVLSVYSWAWMCMFTGQ